MGTFDRVKDFFGMNPEALPAVGDEYFDDEYEAGEYRYDDDHRRGHAAERALHADRMRDHVSSLYADDRRPSGYDRPEERPRRYRVAAERESEFALAGASASVGGARTVAPVRGSVALQPEVEDFSDYDDGLVVQPETALERPRGYADGKSVGENFREGRAVVLDLSLLQPGDARRMIDFAAGLVFALDGSMAKLADRDRTFFMQPQGSDLTESEMREAANQAFRSR